MSKTTKQRLKSAGVTTLLLVVFYLFMQGASLPLQSITEIYEKLDDQVFIKYQPKKIVKEPEPKKVEIKQEEKQEEQQIEPVQVAPQPVVTRKQVDVSILEALNLGSLNQPTKIMDDPGKVRDQTQMEIQVTERRQTDLGLNLLDSDVALFKNTPKAGGAKAGFEIEVGEAKTRRGGLADYGDAGGATYKAPTVKGQSAGPPTIALKTHRQGVGARIQLDVFKALVEWMKKNPADLPGVVKLHLEYDSDALTSRVLFRAGNRQFELFILCFEQTYEVRIALIEGTRVIRLVNQGFTRESEQLRVGSVTKHPETGQIIEIGSSLTAAGSAQNEEFNQIFFSWWESVKHEVQK